MNQTKTVPARLWTQRGKAIVTKNLKQWRRSPCLFTVLHEMSRCVIERELEGNVVYDIQIYKVVRAYLLSERFALTGEPFSVNKEAKEEKI